MKFILNSPVGPYFGQGSHSRSQIIELIMLLFHEFIFATIHFTSCLKQYLKNKKLKTKLWSTKLFGELWNKINSSRSPIFSLKRFNEAVIEVKYWVRYLNFIDLFYEQIKFVTKSVQF